MFLSFFCFFLVKQKKKKRTPYVEKNPVLKKEKSLRAIKKTGKSRFFFFKRQFVTFKNHDQIKLMTNGDA